MRVLRLIFQWLADLTRFTLYSVLFFALMVGASYWVALQFFAGEELRAPDLGDKPVVEALELLSPDRIGLLLERRQPHRDIEKGHIISQFPRAGVRINAGTPIRVVVSLGPPLVTVPDVRGRSKIEAGIRLRKLGLDVGTAARIPRRGVVSGAVLATDPPVGAGVLEGTRINLLLAAGERPQVRQMPNVIGLTLEEAAEALESYGLTLAETLEGAGEGFPAGQVFQQQPRPGASITPATRISVTYQEAYAEEFEEPEVFRGHDESEPAAAVKLDREPRRERSRLPPELQRR